MRRRKDKVFIMLLASILLSVVCAVVTYVSTREKHEAQALVIDTYQAINISERLLSLVKDMESGQHGYVITNDSLFLEPFDEARELIPGEVEQLRRAVTENEQQTRFLDRRIVPALEKKISVAVQIVNIHNDQDLESREQALAAQTAKAYMDTIRLLMNTFVQNERASLADRELSLERNSRLEEWVQFSSFGLIALTCTLAFLRLSKELRKVSALVEKLEDANETLEGKVLSRTQQLSEANEAKDHFLGIASHDLKVPIAGVQGILQLMKLEKKDRDENEVSYLNYMEEACTAMLTLISNLLDINRIDLGEMRFQKEEVVIKDLLARVERIFAAQAEKKNITLTIYGPDIVLYTDPTCLTRILVNLVSNAIKFSASGQSVSLLASQNSRDITFSVIDHGPGIPTVEIPLLFKKFARLTNRPTAGEVSTGLGLAIVKELTELAGGTISVKSAVGKGSEFIVTLPVEKPVAA